MTKVESPIYPGVFAEESDKYPGHWCISWVPESEAALKLSEAEFNVIDHKSPTVYQWHDAEDAFAWLDDLIRCPDCDRLKATNAQFNTAMVDNSKMDPDICYYRIDNCNAGMTHYDCTIHSVDWYKRCLKAELQLKTLLKEK